MALSRRTGRSRFTLVLLILTSITLLTLDFRGFGPIDRARSAVLDVLEPVGGFTSRLFEPVGHAWDGAFHGDQLATENEQLRQQVDDLQGQVTSAEVAKQSLRQLLEQADIPFVGDLPTVRARVISGAIGNFEKTIEIDKGSNDGIKPGMAVVTGQGLIGRVSVTAADRATIKLLSGGDVSVGFSVVATNVLGVATGRGDGPILDAKVDADRIVLPGQIVVTSGVEGSTYPQGLPIGTITKVGDSADTLARDLEITMLADQADLAFVSVVISEPTP